MATAPGKGRPLARNHETAWAVSDAPAEFVESREDQTPNVQLRDRIVEEAYKRGLLLLPCGKSSIRFIPPLVIQGEEIDEGVEILDAAITAARRRG